MVILVVFAREIEDNGVLEAKREWGERGIIRVLILRVCEREDETNVDMDEEDILFCEFLFLVLVVLEWLT